MSFDTEEVDGSNPFGPTIVTYQPLRKSRRGVLPVNSYL
jgi:hypothetical protein